MKYENVEQLIVAYKSGELTDGDAMIVDNDVCSTYNAQGEMVFSMHPYDLLFELLALTSIPAYPA